MTTLLLAEHDNKTLKDATHKALTAAKALGGDVHVLVAGQGCRSVAEAAAKLAGVTKVLLADGAVRVSTSSSSCVSRSMRSVASPCLRSISAT